MVNSKLHLVLASASPRRRELMGHLKIPFEVRTLNVPEESTSTCPSEFALEVARIKGRAVLDDLVHKRPHEDFFVVSADTVVALDGKIYGKPCGREEARAFLLELSGKTHSVYTAVSFLLYYRGESDGEAFVEESRVSFERIGPELLEKYLETGDSLDKAGAYGIQGPSLTFISRVEGSYSNVVGLPLSRFIIEADKFLRAKFPGTHLWPDWF